jgi:hypothetical protein
MRRGSASPNEPAERSRECFKGSVHRPAPPEAWQAFTRMLEAEEVGAELHAGRGLRYV